MSEEIRDDRGYTADHEWVLLADGVATVGITAYAADSLGEIVYVDLPAVGATLTAGSQCGELESTKSVSDLLSPVDGEVLETNPAVLDEPSLVNTDPFGSGWLLRARPSGDPVLLTADEYAAVVTQG